MACRWLGGGFALRLRHWPRQPPVRQGHWNSSLPRHPHPLSSGLDRANWHGAAPGRVRWGKRIVTKELRWFFDGTSMDLRWISGVFHSFPPSPAAGLPIVLSPVTAFCVPPASPITDPGLAPPHVAPAPAHSKTQAGWGRPERANSEVFGGAPL